MTMRTDDAAAMGRTETELEQCRNELATLREQLERHAEQDAETSRASAQALELSRLLDARLTAEEYATPGMRGWVKRRLVRTPPSPRESQEAGELRESSLFDGAWYLRTYPEVVTTGLSAALHYLRHGSAEGKDPGPEFSTRRYLAKHPLVARKNANALLNHLRTHQ